MNTWFLLALGSAISSSGTQALQKLSISRSGYSRWMITFIVNLIGSSILFTVSYFIGFPELQAGFWLAIIITGILIFGSFMAKIVAKAKATVVWPDGKE